MITKNQLKGVLSDDQDKFPKVYLKLIKDQIVPQEYQDKIIVPYFPESKDYLNNRHLKIIASSSSSLNEFVRDYLLM